MGRLAQVFLVSVISSCSNGWSVGSFHEDSNMYSYVEIIDEDSTSHFYADQINVDFDNWCFTHSQWEMVRKSK